MKIKILLFGMILFIFGGCSSPKYLPSSEEIDVNKYGSHIKVVHNSSTKIKGELIAIDSSQVIVLMEDNSRCLSVPVNEIKRFKLRYAKARRYWWTIPVYTLATITHGWFLVFTTPLNLIVTISVTASGSNAFTYNQKDMTFEKLKMFARFPQGVPANIDLDSIE